MADILDELKKLARDEKLTYGSKEALKAIRKGEAKRVFIVSNCPASIKDDIIHYKDMGKFELVELGIPNEEFGIVCKKPFLISVAFEKK